MYSELDAIIEAKKLIADFVQREFQCQLVAVGRHHMIPIANALTEEDRHEIFVYANFKEFTIDTELDGALVKREWFGSVQEMIEKRLRSLKLRELISLDMSTVPMAGRIEYLASSGETMCSTEFIDEKALVEEIRDDLESGMQIVVVLYKDSTGKTIYKDFLNELDYAPRGLKEIYNPYVVAET